MTEDEIRFLVAAAAQARQAAYAPYSHFPVGAALYGPDGQVYAGCNVENASFGLTVCAERNAVAGAVLQGVHEFPAIAIVTEGAVPPCGACRQVLAEFSPAMTVILADTSGQYHVHHLTDLLPGAFEPDQLPGVNRER